MEPLIDIIDQLKLSDVSVVVNSQIKKFSEIRNGTKEEIFKELCFCIMTANCGAEKCIEVHEQIENGFLEFSEEELVAHFRKYGYRFPNIRAVYICNSRERITDLESYIKSNQERNDLRDWIVKSIKGIGYKEASHFLRNIGFNNYAIIDFHIIDVLVKHEYIEKPKTLTKRKYLEIENILQELAQKLELNLAELDLYLWYLETGKVLK